MAVIIAVPLLFLLLLPPAVTRSTTAALFHHPPRAAKLWREQRVSLVKLCAAALPLSEYRSSGDRAQYKLDPSTDSLIPLGEGSSHGSEGAQKPSAVRHASSSVKAFRQRVSRVLSTMFLPAGYPASVAPEYLSFQLWNVAQDLSTYLRGILATQAILEGVGVGKAGATPLAATIQWITRDGASMVSGLVFTSLVSTNFGTNVKVWRMFADIIVDFGITLEMLAPLFPQHFLLCICMASVCKALCGIAAGSSNGAIVEHWARHNNIADVLAKGGAQHTACSLIGLSFGLWFARVANANPLRVWVAYVVLTIVHLGANYAAMKVLALRSLNRSRLDILLRHFLRHNDKDPAAAAAVVPSKFSPAAIGRQEPVLPWLALLNPLNLFRPRCKIRLGVRLSDLTGGRASELASLSKIYEGEKYMLTRTTDSGGRDVVLVALHEGANGGDQIKAYMQATTLATTMTNRGGGGGGPPSSVGLGEQLAASLRDVQDRYVEFEALLRSQGWDLGRVLLETEGWYLSQSSSIQ